MVKALVAVIFVTCDSFTGSSQNGTQCVPNYPGPITGNIARETWPVLAEKCLERIISD